MINLLKNEFNKDIFKIISVLVFYIIFFGIFKAGVDYQRIVPASLKEKVVKEQTFEYIVIYNGTRKELSFNEKKSIPQILESVFEKNIQFTILRDGLRIDSVFNSKRVILKVDGVSYDPNSLTKIPLKENSILEVLY